MYNNTVFLSCLVVTFLQLTSILSYAQTSLSADEKQSIEQILGIQFTGIKEQDALLYDQAKSQLLQTNPVVYNQHFGRKTKPDDFKTIPGFSPTGSYNSDLSAYETAKYNLYMTDRSSYDEWFPEQKQIRIRMSQKEYNGLSPLKKQQVDALDVLIIDN